MSGTVVDPMYELGREQGWHEAMNHAAFKLIHFPLTGDSHNDFIALINLGKELLKSSAPSQGGKDESDSGSV